MDEINDPYVTSTVLKFITKSKDYLSGDGQIEGFIPDAEFSNTHEKIQEENCVKFYTIMLHIRTS